MTFEAFVKLMRSAGILKTTSSEEDGEWAVRAVYDEMTKTAVAKGETMETSFRHLLKQLEEKPLTPKAPRATVGQR